MTTLPDATDWHTELSRLEGRLLVAWVRGPSFRSRWTPDPEQFFTVKSQALARACQSLAKLGVAPDASAQLMGQLAATGDLKRFWKVRQPVLPLDTVSDPDADLGQWRELRISFALRQRLVETLSSLTPASPLPGLKNAVLDAVASASVFGAAKTYSLAEGFQTAYAGMTRRKVAGTHSGYTAIDDATGGIRPGHVWVLGAPTNWGKSSWLLSVADRWLQRGSGRVLYLTCEDDPAMLFTRWLCRRSGAPGKAARDARLKPEQLASVTDQMQVASEQGTAPVMLDGRGRSVESMAEDVRHLTRRHGISLVLVDYLQCIVTERKTEDRRKEINHISRTMTDAIKVSGCGGVLASQLTGEDIRESRDVEHAAEVVLIGRKSETGELSLFLKKNKTGPNGLVEILEWDDTTGSFVQPQPVESDDDYGIPYSN